MTLKMPSDPFGTSDGFFVFLDPPLEDAYPLPDPNLGCDFIMDFEEDLDYSFEVLGDEVIGNARENEPVPPGEVKLSPPTIPSVSARAPRMPTIFEEDEQEEEDGDVTITPSEAQKALLPPDRFARPHSASQLAGAADASQGEEFDSLDTPRPGGEFRFAVYSSCYFGY